MLMCSSGLSICQFQCGFYQLGRLESHFPATAVPLRKQIQKQIYNKMNDQQIIKISKFLSLVLRHEPESIGIELDENGWTGVLALISKVGRKFPMFNMAMLEEVVEKNNKQRFAFNEDKTRIRANQGHSVKVDLDYEAVEPPEFLYHGTVAGFIRDIQKSGLKKMSRHHVHLSKDLDTAIVVGTRRGKAVILTVRAGAMHRDGHKLYVTPNGVWLADEVPPQYIDFP